MRVFLGSSYYFTTKGYKSNLRLSQSTLKTLSLERVVKLPIVYLMSLYDL